MRRAATALLFALALAAGCTNDYGSLRFPRHGDAGLSSADAGEAGEPPSADGGM